MEINKYISELLYKHDCVIVHGFGAMLCHYQPALIDEPRKSFAPPAKSLAFNEKLVVSEGHLEQYIASKLSLSIDDAIALILKDVQIALAQLHTEKSYSITGLGHFYETENGIRFESENKINYLETSFALPEVFIDPIDRSKSGLGKPADRPAVTAPATKTKVTKAGQQGRKWWVATLPVVFLLALGVSFYTFDPFSLFVEESEQVAKKKSDNYNFDDPMGKGVNAGDVERAENIAAHPETTVAAAGVIAPPSFDSEPEHAIVEEETPNVQQNLKTSVKVVISDAVVISEKQGRAHIIAGGFSTLENAEKLRVKFEEEGLESKIIEPYGSVNLYRVTMGDYTTKVEALEKADELRVNHPGLWVLIY